MSAQIGAETTLGGLRVIDLADEKGLYCTKLLADLGADVIKVEKPRGDAARNIGPFWHDIPHPENSLYFAYLNTNKRGITLNIESADGRDILKRLAEGANIIVETYAPGYLDSIGLGYPALKELNPGLIMTSITGFGQSGPYKDFKSPEIVPFAMGGLMFQTGDSDMPPLQPGGMQMYSMTGVYAAVYTLIALYYRNMTGLGQQVDASMQECVISMLELASLYYSYEGVVQRRTGGNYFSSLPGLGGLGGILPCKDGYWYGVIGNPEQWNSLITWMISDGEDVGEFVGPAFEATEKRAGKGNEINAMVSKWAMRYTKRELFEGFQEKHIPAAPINTFNEVAEDPHLKARNYFVEVEHPEMGRIKFPWFVYKLSETPGKITRPSPLIGQHNEEIYRELGFSKEDLITLKGAGVI